MEVRTSHHHHVFESTEKEAPAAGGSGGAGTEIEKIIADVLLTDPSLASYLDAESLSFRQAASDEGKSALEKLLNGNNERERGEGRLTGERRESTQDTSSLRNPQEEDLFSSFSRLNQLLYEEIDRHERILRYSQASRQSLLFGPGWHSKRKMRKQSQRARREEDSLSSSPSFPPQRSSSMLSESSLGSQATATDSVSSPPGGNGETRESTPSSPPSSMVKKGDPLKQDQMIFFRAALELLEEKAKTTPQAIATRAGLAPDTILTGYMKTSKDSPIPLFNQKFVVLTHGKMTYYEDVSGPLTRGSKKKLIILDPRQCSVRAVNSQRFQGKHVFEIVVNESDGKIYRRLWMAKSEEERAMWMAAVVKAMQPNASNLGHGPRSSDSDVKIFLETQAAVRAAENRTEYTQALAGLRSGLCIPVDWVHEQSASVGTEASDMAQLFKDMKRDSIEINAVRYNGAEGVEFIVGALTRSLLEYDRKIQKITGSASGGEGGAGQRFASHRPLSEGKALGFAREILLACNRTQSGGDAYDAVDLLCRNMDLVVLCPTGSEAAPLKIEISISEMPTEEEVGGSRTSSFHLHRGNPGAREGPRRHRRSRSLGQQDPVFSEGMNGRFSSDSSSDLKSFHLPGGAGGGGEAELLPSRPKKELQIQVSAQALTSYKVCPIDPQDDGMDSTWAYITASFQQIYRFGSLSDIAMTQRFIRIVADTSLSLSSSLSPSEGGGEGLRGNGSSNSLSLTHLTVREEDEERRKEETSPNNAPASPSNAAPESQLDCSLSPSSSDS